MCLNIYVVNTDERQKYLSESLNGIKKGKVNQIEKEKGQKVIILPTPLYKYDLNAFNDKLKEELIYGNAIAFAGAINAAWKRFFYQNKVEYYDFMIDENISMENAEITAEATLMLYIANSKLAVNGEKIIIAGYGRCGRLIAAKFAALGAKVTVMARSRDARKKAKEDGHNAIPFSYGPQEAYGTAALINTVPSTVVGNLILSELQKECLLIEIASAPGGFDMKAVKQSGLRYIEAPGLPSKYLQKASGRVLANCINRFVKTSFNNGVENIWIYQVSP